MEFYEILKASKLGAGAAPDMYTALFAQKISGGEAELSGVPPLTFRSNGTPLLDYLISGNTLQNGTPTPTNPIIPEGCGELETTGEKAGQYKILIPSAGQTASIYLGETQTTRRIKKLVLTGEETVINTGGNAPYRIYIDDIVQTTDKKAILFFCSHYQAVSNNASWATYSSCVSWAFSGSSNVNALNFRDTSIASEADFKAFLSTQYAAGTPVVVWYVLAESEIAVVNEPLMRIGDYADTLSKAQALVSIPTNNGSTTVDVDTTLKPSEVYIKYRT